ncbi:MAG: LysM peptidoglycan-binding domain-containing protein [Anaerolineae bacterium]|nr:LysM peptidoglycan-binding domain-containing protein [Anaerolineae bacterium]
MSTQPNNATVVHRQQPKPKPKRRSPLKLILGGLAAALLAVVAVIAAVVAYAFWGNPEFTDRPLVLIHSPLNLEQFSEGDGVLVHATARSKAGIRRVELWADDMLIAQRDAEKDALPTSMVLSADWVPTIAGSHRLVVRALSAGDVDGQASILVESTENDEPEPTGAHTVQEGETLDTIAAGHGTTPEDLTILNPGLDPAAPPAPGSEIIVPDSEPPSEGTQPIPTDSEPPPAVGEAPALFDFLFFGELVSVPQPPAEPTQLRLELLSLRTPQDYEGLTCYIGMAGREPRRHPDADWNPSTDETFARVKDKHGTGWNVADYLSGKRVPAFSWPEDRPLPFDISCVGISGGGTQALRLGRVELFIPPDDWDSTVRQTEVVGPEGSFIFGYRVGRARPDIHTIGGPFPEPDPNMPVPTNVHTISRDAYFAPETETGDGTAHFYVDPNAPPLLMWRYEPDGYPVPIAGFRIYLDGALMWMESADRKLGDSHYTVLPPEWMHPPCGEHYTVTVTAWTPGGVDGFESSPGTPEIVFETPEDCRLLGRFTFKTLQTFTLDDDGDNENRTEKIGPPHGDFYANEDLVSFDTGSLDDDSAANGLRDDWTYQLYDNNYWRDFWRFGQPPSFFVEIDDGEPFDIGFTIWDEDSGNDDELICEGHWVINPYDPSYEGEFDSTNRRCKVTYLWEPSTGNPRPDVAAGSLTPGIWIENVIADGATNALLYTVRNTGGVAWSYIPLEIRIDNQVDNSETLRVLENIYLAPDQSINLEYRPPSGSPQDFCLTPDPNNKVEEGTYDHEEWPSRRVCAPWPDLKATPIVTDFDRFWFRIKNEGTGIWSHYPLEIAVTDRGGIIQEVVVLEDFYLEPGQTTDQLFQAMTVSASTPDLCLVAHPNMVQVEDGRLGDFDRGRMGCQDQPDLRITDVTWRGQNDGGDLDITVQNIGDRISVGANIDVRAVLPDGTVVQIGYWEHAPLALAAAGSVLTTPLTGEQRRQLLSGYELILNMDWFVSESTTHNNSYVVGGPQRLAVALCDAEIPHVGDILLQPLVSGGYALAGGEVGIYSDEFGSGPPYRFTGCKYPPRVFEIAGDQELGVRISASGGADFGFEDIWHSPQDDWDIAGIVGSETPGADEPCSQESRFWVEHDYHIHLFNGTWRAGYLICRLGEP